MRHSVRLKSSLGKTSSAAMARQAKEALGVDELDVVVDRGCFGAGRQGNR